MKYLCTKSIFMGDAGELVAVEGKYYDFLTDKGGDTYFIDEAGDENYMDIPEDHFKLLPADEGLRFDEGKEPLHLVTPELQFETAKVLAFGAEKYAARNWEKGMAWSKVFGSLMRHCWKLWRGEDRDEETGLPHVDHIACNAMFLQAYFHRKIGEDDRPCQPD